MSDQNEVYAIIGGSILVITAACILAMWYLRYNRVVPLSMIYGVGDQDNNMV